MKVSVVLPNVVLPKPHGPGILHVSLHKLKKKLFFIVMKFLKYGLAESDRKVEQYFNKEQNNVLDHLCKCHNAIILVE